MSSDNQISPELKFSLDVTNGLAIALNVLIQKLDERDILPLNDVLNALRTQYSMLKTPEQSATATAHGVNLLISTLEHAIRSKQSESKQAH
ncbi:hypothetical protein DKF91_15245 [Salmonella enterica]|uniref:Uncharacterized protein n=1 Tax=Salmonella enterica TaxID=28901 RepID=A0A758BNY6_SALER|nr:hypothetical protein [Salmonella enterica]EBH3493137.1 hypothetical protein [Salmonella enterica subsp. enterica serovar Kentucky]EBV5318877.1 hypothetical protein [Salmonella enterica subsp. enterica serovar Bredeney]EBX7467573.1 hypothetical protein [Salmonella enterica subsp. enterica serovar Bareilly]ECB4486321.1 hypothetical protein [Salmonella enterica subsp. enterica serovar Java]ECE0732404.1 hypothetical protein [Salmonella enterica subsp. houtenae]ECG2605627.1 hypothetical protein